MMSKRQADRLFDKAALQIQFMNSKVPSLAANEETVFRLLLNIQNRLDAVRRGKIKEDRKVREMHLLQEEMKAVNIELKKVFDNEKQSN